MNRDSAAESNAELRGRGAVGLGLQFRGCFVLCIGIGLQLFGLVCLDGSVACRYVFCLGEAVCCGELEKCD